jgi:protein-L-isoaspartate(D-aspartate) O-methyltransferase
MNDGDGSLWAMVLAALPRRPGMKVLEIGAGAGWSTEQLVATGAKVWAMERDPERARRAAARVGSAAEIIVGLGQYGHPDAAPYDAVVAGCAVRTVPRAWFDQLATDGVLIVPVGAPGRVQELTRWDRTPWGSRRRKRLGAVRCDPLYDETVR